MKRSAPVLIALLVAACGAEDAVSLQPAQVTGTVVRHADFPSDHVDPRHVDVWLPAGYEASDRAYPVLYMHDGQNLFDPSRSYIGVDWGVDEAMTAIEEETGAAAIVVGVWNTPKRFPEYMPRGMAERWSEEKQTEVSDYGRLETIVSDEYLRFLVEELKPFIDQTYRTEPGRESTLTMGSSMGGLISVYAVTEHPDVFGAAGAISTHWPAADEAAIAYLEEALPEAGAHRIWYDFGTETLDAGYEPWQIGVDALMRRRGYTGTDWITVKFTGHDHSERSWQRRMPAVLAWLLAPWITGEIDGARLLTDQAALSSDAMEGRRFAAEAPRAYVLAALEASGAEEVSEMPFRFGEDRGGTNVLASVPGTAPDKGVIVITAHFDHLGVRDGEIFNGADDNASGTAALLELARQIAADPLEHTVWFAAVDAEEVGLRGARAFVEEPPVDLEDIVLNVNMDMVSRSDKGELYAAGTYHYPGLRDLVEPLVAGLPVKLTFGHDLPGTGSDDWSNASDHAPFHQAGIPFLYFGVEDHPGYHNPSDDFEETTSAFYIDAVVSIERILRHLDAELTGRVAPRP